MKRKVKLIRETYETETNSRSLRVTLAYSIRAEIFLHSACNIFAYN